MKYTISLLLIFCNFFVYAQGSYDWREHNRDMDEIDWGSAIQGLLILVFFVWLIYSLSERLTKVRTKKKSHQKSSNTLKYYEWQIPEHDHYVGERKDGKKHGNGEMTYADNGKGARFYKTHNGCWENDEKHGPGIEITLTHMDSKFTTKGIWKNGEINGVYDKKSEGLTKDYHFIGEKVKKGQYEYLELFNKDELERCRFRVKLKGKWIFNDLIFEGEWRFVDSRRQHHQNVGKITYKRDNLSIDVSNGDIYEGVSSDNNIRNGFGKMTYVDGSSWEGRWHIDKKVLIKN